MAVKQGTGRVKVAVALSGYVMFHHHHHHHHVHEGLGVLPVP